LPEVVSFTTLGNVRSMKVMEAIGMKRDREFDHPRLLDNERLRRCVLYRLASTEDVPSREPRVNALAFAAALDADDFERARALLSPECVYEVRGKTLRGTNDILRSYAEATRDAHARFDEVVYESRVEEAESELRIRFTDIVRSGGREHRFQSTQHLAFDADGRVARVVHEDLRGEREGLAAFLAGS
jgi:hypothetical protein